MSVLACMRVLIGISSSRVSVNLHAAVATTTLLLLLITTITTHLFLFLRSSCVIKLEMLILSN